MKVKELLDNLRHLSEHDEMVLSITVSEGEYVNKYEIKDFDIRLSEDNNIYIHVEIDN